MSEKLEWDKEINRLVYITGDRRGVIIQKIASMHGVTRQTVYNWLREDTFSNNALIAFALEAIERESKEGQKDGGVI